MTGALSQDWESCQFPFVLDEKSAIVPIGSAGERPEARTGSLWRRSVELRVSRAVGLRWQAVFGCQSETGVRGRLGEVAACIKPVTVTPFAHQLTNNFQYRPSMAHNQSHLKRRR